MINKIKIEVSWMRHMVSEPGGIGAQLAIGEEAILSLSFQREAVEATVVININYRGMPPDWKGIAIHIQQLSFDQRLLLTVL